MRAYFFGNMYLSSIQQGIQAAHATHEMFVKWTGPRGPCSAGSILFDWAENHKTMILLNGGYSATIQELVDFFAEQGEHVVNYPWAPFYEEEASLNGALTTVGIILPEKIYLVAAAIRGENTPDYETVDGQIARAYSTREKIWDNGEIVIGPENTLGFDIDKDIVLSYTKWEAQLIDRLNQFTTMAS